MFTAIALGSLILLALSTTANAPTMSRVGKRKPMTPLPPDAAGKIDPEAQYPETARALAKKWGKVFGIPAGWIVSHCYVESKNKPLAHSPVAYGLMQIKMTPKMNVAEDIASRIRKSKFMNVPAVSSMMEHWHGKKEDLYNPDLNVMLGAFYLRHLRDLFKTNNQKIIAGAYNQGPGAMRAALADGELTDAMNEYISRMEDAKQRGYA